MRAKRVAAIVGLVVTVSGGTAACSAAQNVAAARPRDEATFLRWVTQIPPILLYSYDHRRAVVGEGDRACAWIEGQPDGPRVDPSGRYSPVTLARRYVAATRDRPIARLSAYRRVQIAIQAWDHLCSSVSSPHLAPIALGDD